MIFKKAAFFITILFILVACSTNPPTSYYQLQSIASVTKSHHQIKPNTLSILINPIKFPEYLDRPQLITRINDYKFQLSENHHWAEPLKHEFSRIFIENINQRISPHQAVIFLKPKTTLADITVNLEVLQLDVNTNNQATLEVKWEYWRSDNTSNKTRIIKIFKFSSNNKSYESKVQAQSQAIALFSDHIVDTLTPLF